VRIARFSAGDEVSYGLVGTPRAVGATGGGEVVAELAGHPFGADRDAIRLTGTTHPLTGVRLLAPVLPSKVVAFAWPGPAATAGAGDGPHDGPVMYLKPSTAVCGPADAIRYPSQARRVAAGGALAVVIGRLCRQVPADQAGAVVLGYTCAVDVGAPDLADRDGQWARARGFDTFCPLGPWIETDPGAGDLGLVATVNGQARQRAASLREDVGALVAFASSVMTLLPGDVLLTGGAAPGGDAGALECGDEIAVTIGEIGTLTSKVDKGD